MKHLRINRYVSHSDFYLNIRMITILKVCILLLCSSCVSAQLDAYTSTTELEIFVKTHGRFLETLQEYYDKEQNKIAFIEKYLNESKREYEKISKSDSEKYLGNPINAYKYIKRLSGDLKHVEKVINMNHGFLRDKSMKYPTNRDLIGVTNGLIRLQKVYQLNVSDLAKGILKGNFSANNQPYVEQVQPMNEADLYLMSSFPAKILGHEQKIAWLLELLKYIRSARPNCKECSLEIEIIDNVLEEYNAIGNSNETINWLNERISLKPKDPKAKKYRAMLLNLKKKNEKLHRYDLEKPVERDKSADRNEDEFRKDTKPYSVDDEKYTMSLCGRDISTNVSRKSFKCFYKYGPHPFLRLARVKVEQLHSNPDFILYHGVISDKEIQTLQHLHKSRIQRNKENKMNKANDEYRVAKAALLEDDLEVVSKISRRTSQFTELGMNSSDRLNVVNYGVGGYYVNHYDFLSTTSPEFSQLPITGDKLATIMFYLSNVEQGGATLFPNLDLRVYPVKGSALFWHNLYPSGDGNYNTLHLSCPILRGNKWIAIKWPREAGQNACPIWYSKIGLMTKEKYIKANIREPLRHRKSPK